MKQLAVLAFLFVSFGASAQTASFKADNAMHAAGIHTQFNCTLQDLNGAEHLQTIVASMKATPGLLKLDVLETTPNTALLRIVTNQAENTTILEKAFTAAGVNNVSVGDKKVKTAKLHTVIATR